MSILLNYPGVCDEQIIDAAIENAEKHNLIVDEEEIEEWEWHFRVREMETDELIHILKANERKYLDSGYRAGNLEQIVAISRVLKERRPRC
jgi:hypothetical protein